MRNLVATSAGIATLLAVTAIAGPAPAPGNVTKAATSPTKCTDVPIWMTVLSIGGGVLAGDSKGTTYKSGMDGVNFAAIHICSNASSSPTYDATLGLEKSTRTMGFTFPAAIGGSIIAGPPPVWADGVSFQTKPVVYVRNILWGRMNGQYIFTTRAIVKSIIGPGDSATYDLRLQPQYVDAIQNDPPYADTNSPNQTASVTVQDVPGTCRITSGGTFDSWIVTVNPPSIGTLYKLGERNQPYMHSGQYVVPFKLLVEAQSCIPASLTMPPQ